LLTGERWLCGAQVYCNGEVVKTTKGTQPEYKVDIWSGNHSFYQGKQTTVVVEGGRLEKFKNKFGGFDDYFDDDA